MPSTTLQPRVAVIVLNYNSWQETVRCLESLRTTTYSRWQVIVVDNGSTNDSVRQIQAWAARVGWPVADAVRNEESASLCPLVLVTMEQNRGFTGGANFGLRYALRHDFRYLALLNNDITVDPRFVEALVELAEREPHAGIVGPKVYEREQPEIIQSVGAHINCWKAKFPPRGNRERDLGQHNQSCVVDYVSVAMMVRREVVEQVGGFDEAFSMYVEEVDWCCRIASAGYGVWLAPQSRIWHRGAVTTGAMPRPESQYYRFRNRIFFMRKHARWYHWLVFGPYLLRHVLGKSIGYLAAGRREHRLALWRALRDGLCQKLSSETTRL